MLKFTFIFRSIRDRYLHKSFFVYIVISRQVPTNCTLESRYKVFSYLVNLIIVTLILLLYLPTYLIIKKKYLVFFLIKKLLEIVGENTSKFGQSRGFTAYSGTRPVGCSTESVVGSSCDLIIFVRVKCTLVTKVVQCKRASRAGNSSRTTPGARGSAPDMA